MAFLYHMSLDTPHFSCSHFAVGFLILMFFMVVLHFCMAPSLRTMIGMRHIQCYDDVQIFP